MTWPASERYDLAAAPDGLAIVQDLLNTRPARRPVSPDLLATVRSAQDWADETMAAWAAAGRHRPARARLTAADVEQLRVVRDQVVAFVRSKDEHPPAVLVGITVRAAQGAGGLTLEPDGEGWLLVAGAVLLEIHRAQQLDLWRRMKTCRNEACPGTFFDRSPNNSGAWHDVRTCGNVANLRAARARRRNAAS